MNRRQRMLRHGPRGSVLAASIGALIASGGLSSTALGQDSSSDQTTNPEDTIVVTGTRIRRDDFSATNATTVVTADDMRNLGVFSVAEMVNQLPNNIASVSPEATAASPFYLGASIANLRGLNTAYGVRTLTLVDSRRMTPTNNGGGVDMNFIPSALVSRIETVTGGASATYGADAMAGVVNVILDDSIENIKVDLSYQTTSAGDGDTYNFSFGTGFKFFDNDRGNLTIGVDSSRIDAIEDCTTRAYCQNELGLMRNGQAGIFDIPYVLNPGFQGGAAPNYNMLGRGTDIFYPGQPEWLQTTGHHYTVTPNGVMRGDGVAVAGDINNQADPNWDLGWYEFSPDGLDVHPIYNSLSAGDLAAINSVGVQVGAFSSGSAWATPFGQGKGIYEDVPIQPKTSRDNLFARFAYELEGGIKLEATLTAGQTESTTLQNMSRGNMQSFCVYPWNAYVQEASPLMRDVVLGRAVAGASTDARFTYGSFVDGNTVFNTPYGPINGGASGSCFQGPFLGGSYQDRAMSIEAALFDFPPGFVAYKDFSDQVDRRNTNKSNSKSLQFTATGPMFEGGSWDWDVFAQVGATENRQTLTGWRAARRWDMALDAVMDSDGVIKCGVDIQNVPFIDPRPGDNPEDDFQEYGTWVRNKWQDYLFAANFDQTTAAQRQAIFDGLSNGCVPFNPFGSQPLTPEQIAYVFPTLYEGTDNDQNAVSIDFSGDAWKGIGNAGPMRMAAGLDWRQNDTQNMADPNRYLGADFNFVGNSSSGQFDRIYGDNWWGRTTTKEAWVEFDLPLVRDKIAADSLTINTSYRHTENDNVRISGLEGVTTPPSGTNTDSWKATMSWQPVDMMRVNITRSADVRAPAARELYATNSYATESGGQTEIRNPFRYGLPLFSAANPAGDTLDGDQYIRVQGGNANLQSETSITETLGLVFQPVETVPGLQVSVNYYETTIEGGIQRVGVNQTLNLCRDEIVNNVPMDQWKYCNQIEFGDPYANDPTGAQQYYQAGALQGGGGLFTVGDPLTDQNGDPVAAGSPNPYFQYTNIVQIAESTINVEDYISRGIDYSVQYFTQLSGGGSLNARALVTRYLLQSIDDSTLGRIDVSGQTGGNNITDSFGSFAVNYSPTPRVSGNLYMTYAKNAFAITAQARYIGAGKLNTQSGWIGPGDATYYTNQFQGENAEPSVAQCRQLGAPDTCTNPVLITYNPNRDRTVANNDLPSWTVINMTFNYDFGRSRLSLDKFDSLSVYLNVNNVADRVPSFFSGTGAGGLNTALFSGLGRTYELGVRMEF